MEREKENKQAMERQGEDYSGPADYDSGGSINMNDKGERSSSSSGQNRQSKSSHGERFGEFEDTGIGVDLTVEMENTDARTGLVKGGEKNADDVAGPGQYGGKAGGLSDNN